MLYNVHMHTLAVLFYMFVNSATIIHSVYQLFLAHISLSCAVTWVSVQAVFYYTCLCNSFLLWGAFLAFAAWHQSSICKSTSLTLEEKKKGMDRNSPNFLGRERKRELVGSQQEDGSALSAWGTLALPERWGGDMVSIAHLAALSSVTLNSSLQRFCTSLQRPGGFINRIC